MWRSGWILIPSKEVPLLIDEEDDADVEYRRCYARKVRQRNSFAAVLRQAQSLGDLAATSSPTTREIRAPYESE